MFLHIQTAGKVTLYLFTKACFWLHFCLHLLVYIYTVLTTKLTQAYVKDNTNGSYKLTLLGNNIMHWFSVIAFLLDTNIVSNIR